MRAARARRLIAHAVLIGVGLGPNLSVTGSLATILWLLALRKEKLDVSFARFLQVGAIAMPAALLLSRRSYFDAVVVADVKNGRRRDPQMSQCLK